MNIIKKLKNNNASFIKYYGKSDLSTNWLIRDLINNEDVILEHFKNIEVEKEINVSQYIDFIWAKLIIPIEEIIPDLNDNVKEKITNIVNEIKTFEIENSIIRSFIKENYKIIFNKKTYEEDSFFYEIVLETFKEIFKTIDFYSRDIFEFIEDNFSYLILRHFPICDKYYSKNEQHFYRFMSDEKNKNLFSIYNFSGTFNDLNKSKQKYIKIFLENKAEEVLRETIEIAQNANEDNYLEIYFSLEQISKVIKENNFRFTAIYNLDKVIENIKEVEIKYLKKHGKTFEFGPINFEEMFNNYKKAFNEKETIFNFIQLTHVLDKNTNKFTSNFRELLNRENALTDIIASTSGTDYYFTSSKLMGINTNLQFFIPILLQLVTKDETRDYMHKYMSDILSDIDRIEFENNGELIECFEGLYPTLLKILNNNNQQSNINNYESTSLSMFIISIIEKLLRRFIINRSRDLLYYSDNDLNLGDILRTRKNNGVEHTENVLLDHFDIELVKTLEYLLSKTPDTNIGNNLRNNLMHNRNYKFKEITNGTVLHVYYLLIYVVNGIFGTYITDELNKNG